MSINTIRSNNNTLGNVSPIIAQSPNSIIPKSSMAFKNGGASEVMRNLNKLILNEITVTAKSRRIQLTDCNNANNNTKSELLSRSAQKQQ